MLIISGLELASSCQHEVSKHGTLTMLLTAAFILQVRATYLCVGVSW
jgi:hypothetical protein